MNTCSKATSGAQNPCSTFVRQFTVADFHILGARHGFAYRLPGLDVDAQNCQSRCVVQGRILEMPLQTGLNLTLSDITVHESYEATSNYRPQLCAIVMLQGQAQTVMGQRGQKKCLTANGGISALYADTSPMTGIHLAGQCIQSVNLSLSIPEAVEDARLADLFDTAMRQNGLGLRCWQAPAFLRLSLLHLLHSPWDEPAHRLLCEGTGLQLLGHALGELGQATKNDNTPCARDRVRLERVRAYLHESPGEVHTLANLACLAHMSQSALRAKFFAAYHCSVFAYLRERRLEVARTRLAQGYSVQQVAHWVGYRHASNFATAFKARYGVSPGDVH